MTATDADRSSYATPRARSILPTLEELEAHRSPHPVRTSRPAERTPRENTIVSKNAARLGLVLLSVMALSTCTSSTVTVLGYMMPRSAPAAAPVQAAPAADSFDPGAASGVPPVQDAAPADQTSADDQSTAQTPSPQAPQPTPTAPESTKPAAPPKPAAPAENTAPYRAAMKTRAAAVRAAYNKIAADSLIAADNQWDLRWPGILSGEADTLGAKASDVAAVKPPSSLSAKDSAVDSAARAVVAGANAYKAGIAALSADQAEAGYEKMEAAMKQLEAALRKIPV